MIRVLESARPVYVNPLPQLKSRQCYFPSLIELEDGALLASFTIGEAMESVDCLTHLSRSEDGGRTWSRPWPIFPEFRGIPRSETLKITALGGSRIAALGYAFDRPDPSLPVGNPETGGLLDDMVFWAVSEDAGRTWSEPGDIQCAWGPHVEASAPLTVLQDGSWIAPITGFPAWDGTMRARNCGRVIRSFDLGKTWNDETVCMAFPGDRITCYEQRLCQLASGAIVVIGWNENPEGGRLLPNHFTASFDNGLTFAAPRSTGIGGQTASVCALGGERLLSLHAVRRDTDRPGVYACEVDFSEGVWKILDQRPVWEPNAPVLRDKSTAEIFAYMKFGQPGALRLRSGEVMMIHWAEENGQCRCLTTRLAIA